MTVELAAQPPPVQEPQAAFGKPGLDPHWATGAKAGVGTACNADSHVWFTLADGILTELYYPRVDTPNTKDVQFLVSDGYSFAHEERRDLRHEVSCINPHALAYRLINTDPQRRYRLVKTVFADPARPVVLMRVAFEPLQEVAQDYTLYLLAAPRLGNQGAGNSAKVVTHGQHAVLVAWRDGIHLAVAASVALLKASCGYVGFSDGWQDLRNFEMDWTFPEALDGHVALTAQLDWKAPRASKGLTVAMGFGTSEAEAIEQATASLKTPYVALLNKYVAQWKRYCASLTLPGPSDPHHRQAAISAMVLKAHEDKRQPGAAVASLAIPWGEATGDANAGGYHLVWPRDLYQVAMGRLAVGDAQGARDALGYLERIQQEDGGWPQNCWLDGQAYWQGKQLDQVGYPILLAWKLHTGQLLDRDVYPMVRKAASYLLRYGPVTPQERWEENAGYSVSTLAVEIAALVCAAQMARLNGEPAVARYLEEVADSWNSQLEAWTFTTCGELLPGYPEYYERIASIAPEDLDCRGCECRIFMPIKNLPAERQRKVSQCCVIDGGFLELVRLGLRAPADPHILKTLPVYDAILKVETPNGSGWRRYNHDGYGQHDDGSAYDGTGRGRAWPLLTGERGHYELAAGRDATGYLAAMSRFANAGGMIPEQIWDAEDVPERGLFKGQGTGSATPLAWAHAESLMLWRSVREGKLFELVDEVFERSVKRCVRSKLEIWTPAHPIRKIAADARLRIQADQPGLIRYSLDGWKTAQDRPLQQTELSVWFLDLLEPLPPGGQVVFTFRWQDGQWAGRDVAIQVAPRDASGAIPRASDEALRRR